MDTQDWRDQSVDKEIEKHSKWAEHCKTFLVKDSHGAVKELVFPKALDLDRPKRERTIFSNRQLNSLEESFRQNQYLVGKDRTTVAMRLGLSETQVKVWFQNRRTKHKKDSERTGGSKDLQAESKAAQNVLKLLEYKTALSYNTFLNSTPPHFDVYQVPHSNTIRSPTCQTSIACIDNLDKRAEPNLTNEDLSVGKTATKCEDTAFESQIEKRAMTINPHSSSTGSEMHWEKDLSSSTTLQEYNLDSNTQSLTSSPSERSNDLSLHNHSLPSEANAYKPVWNPSTLENRHPKTSQLLSGDEPRVERSTCPDNSFGRAETMQNVLSHNGEQARQRETTVSSDCRLPDGLSSSGNEQTCVPNKERTTAHSSYLCTSIPSPGTTQLVTDTTRDYYRVQSQDCDIDNISTTFPSLCAKKYSISNYARSHFNKMSYQSKIQDIYNTNYQENAYQKRSLPNFLQYPENMSNMTYQQTVIAPVHKSRLQNNHFDSRNVKQFSYYAPHFHSLAVNEPATRLEALQYVPTYNTYRDVYAQAPQCAHNLATSQPSVLSHPSMMAVSTQYHGYPANSSWPQTFPECFQKN